MRRAFTLIELLIVVSMIMMMAGIFMGYGAMMHREHEEAAWLMETEQRIAHLERETRAATANLVSVQPLESPATLGLELAGSEGELRRRVLAVDEDGLVLLAGEASETYVRRLGSADAIELVPYRLKEREEDEVFREGFFVRVRFQMKTPLRTRKVQHEFFVGRRLS